MNSSSTILSGLLASLLLSLGFSRLAARFDHLEQTTATNTRTQGDQLISAAFCVSPCRWQEV